MSKQLRRSLSRAEGNRFGAQGQFAEDEKESGWNQFELRMWDGRIGRWMTTDPANQYPSPYLGMGNNPVNAIDKDGAVAAKPLDDYRLNEDGSIELIQYTDDKFDVLYSYEDGVSTLESVKVLDQSVLKELSTGTFLSYNSASSNKDLKSLFHFVTENSSVEWNYFKTDRGLSTVGTSFNEHSVSGYKAEMDYQYSMGHRFELYQHSHPSKTANFPSGYHYWKFYSDGKTPFPDYIKPNLSNPRHNDQPYGDYKTLLQHNKAYGAFKHSIYHPKTKSTIKYDKTGYN